jgi:hypothetical protein
LEYTGRVKPKTEFLVCAASLLSTQQLIRKFVVLVRQPKTKLLACAASPLGTQHYQARAKTGCLESVERHVYSRIVTSVI